jgi:site-specific DNA-cytosine methylase
MLLPLLRDQHDNMDTLLSTCGLKKDLTRDCGIRPRELAMLIGAAKVDVIVGGPLRQGYSMVRQRDGGNQNRPRHSLH